MKDGRKLEAGEIF